MAKITFITGSLPPIRCGVGHYAQTLLSKLAGQQNLDITVISTQGTDGEAVTQPLKRVSSWSIWRLGSLLKTVKETAPEVVHIQYPAVGYKRELGINLLPYLIRLRLRSSTLIITLHEYHDSRWLGRFRDFITIVPAQKIILSNDADKRALPIWLRRRAVVVPISSSIPKVPADPGAFAAVMHRVQLDPGRPTLLFFGFAQPSKGLEALADALAQPGLEKYQALLVSDLNEQDPYQYGLVAKFSKLNVDRPRVAWTGFLPEGQVSAILQAGKYFVLPQHEPVNAKSSTAITAVLHGLILVSTAGTKPRVTLPFKHGENAYLVRPMNGWALAEAIAALDADETVQKAIKQGTKALAHYFSWDTIVEQHRELYEARR